MAWNSTWDRVFEGNEWGKYPSESLVRFIARNYYGRPRAKVRVLELGCGPGANIWFLARERFKTFGIDGSAVAIGRANEMLSREKLKADLRVGEINSLPYSDCYFDAVVEVECLSCNSFEDTREILSEAHRVLKPGGKLFSQSFSERTSIGRARPRTDLSYRTIKSGPLGNLGFIRLTDQRSLKKLYSERFKLQAVDVIERTFASRSVLVSEWLIEAQRK